MKNKKVTQHDIDKQNKKLLGLEKHLQYLINQHVVLKEQFNKIMKEYKDSCDILKIKEKEKSNAVQYKKDYEKTKDLEKQRHDLILKLETFKNEHLSIKQTLEEYENNKKKLQSKYDRLLKENSELKNKEEEIDYYIQERVIEKKGLEDFLEDKIKEETQLRNYFDEEFKKLKEAKKNFVPPQKKFDLTINPANSNNNNIYNNSLDFHNLSNVMSVNDEDISIKDNDVIVKKNSKQKIKKDDKNEEENLINGLNNMDIKDKKDKNFENKNEIQNKENKKDVGFNSQSSGTNILSVSLESDDDENSD